MGKLEESRAYNGAPGLLDSINNNGVALHRLGGEEYASTPLRHQCGLGTRESLRINGETWGKINALWIASDTDVWGAGTAKHVQVRRILEGNPGLPLSDANTS